MSERRLIEASGNSDPERLQALLDQFRGDITGATREQTLVAAAEKGRVDNLKVLVKSKIMLLHDEEYADALVLAFEAAIRNDQVGTGEFLAHYYEKITSAAIMDAVDTFEMSEQAIPSSHISTLRLLVEESILNTEDEQSIELAIKRDDPEVFELFLVEGETTSDYLQTIAGENSPNLMRLALADKNLTEGDLADAARTYLASYWQEMGTSGIEVLLSDSRSGIATLLILRESLEREGATAADLTEFCSQSQFLNMDALSSEERRLVADELISSFGMDKLSDRLVQRVYLGAEQELKARGMHGMFTEELFVDPPGEYWKVARFLLLTKPTAERLLEYMRDMHSRDIYLAARTIFDPTLKYSSEVGVFRALLLFLVYPRLTAEESTRYLREEDGYSEHLIRESNWLTELVKR